MSNIETDVAVLEQKLSATDTVLERLADSFDMISDVSNSLTKMLAVHEEKFSNQAVFNHNIDKAIDNIVQENKKTQNEFFARMESSENKYISLIEDVKKELKDRDTSIKKAEDEKEKEINKRISSLEKWRWTIVGAALAVGATVGYVIPIITKIIS
jgi:chromosome segregation ATPase